MRIGRNDPCSCGSGKKYKLCCLGREPDWERERQEGERLVKEIKAHLPMTFYPTPMLLPIYRKQGVKLDANQPLQAIFVAYSGIEGGVVCGMDRLTEEQVADFATSLTHLRAPSDHPLREQIEAYQRLRNESRARGRS